MKEQKNKKVSKQNKKSKEIINNFKIPTAEEYQLLTNMIWGWDLGKMSWMIDKEEADLIINKFSKRIIPLWKEFNNVEDEVIQRFIGYALIVQVDFTEEELIKNERICSHSEEWSNKGLYYLSEIVIAKEYRQTRAFGTIMLNIIKYCKENEINTLYTTAVSNDSRLIFDNKKETKYYISELLATKENNRKVYKLLMK